MAIDFIYFDVEEYRSRVKALTDQELQKKEVVKIRNAHSGTAGIISGAVLAPVTGGASLFATVAGGRTIHVADQKLEVIRAELVRRRLPLHTQTTRDQAIPAIFGGITGCMGLNMGLEGAVTAKAASVFANNSAITTSAPLDRVRTAPSEPSSSFAATTWRRLRRSHTDTEVSRYRLAQFPYTAEERQLFRQFDGLVAREHALRQQYLRLRNATLAAAGTKWYSYVVHLYPCVPETLVVPTEADVWITQLRRRTDSRGQWDMDTQQHFSSWARDGLKTFQGDLDAVSARLDKWQLLVLKVSAIPMSVRLARTETTKKKNQRIQMLTTSVSVSRPGLSPLPTTRLKGCLRSIARSPCF